MSNIKPMPAGLTNSISREFSAYLRDMRSSVNEKIDDQSGLSGTYTFGGGGSGDVESMTFVNGILTGVTEVT